MTSSKTFAKALGSASRGLAVLLSGGSIKVTVPPALMWARFITPAGILTMPALLILEVNVVTEPSYHPRPGFVNRRRVKEAFDYFAVACITSAVAAGDAGMVLGVLSVIQAKT